MGMEGPDYEVIRAWIAEAIAGTAGLALANGLVYHGDDQPVSGMRGGSRR